MRLIDADELEPDAEWDSYYDGFIAYSELQIKNAPTVEAVPISVIDDIKAEIAEIVKEEKIIDNLHHALIIIDKYISGKEKE